MGNVERFLRRPTADEMRKATSRIGKLLYQFEGMAEKIDRVNIALVVTNKGCEHACSFCGSNCGPYDPRASIPMEIIDQADKLQLFSPKPRWLTGGEPLDHPEIVRLIRDYGMAIDATNGFSGSTHQPAEWRGILGQLGDNIRRISFNVADRWKGNNPGRDAVVKQWITKGGRCILEPRAIFGSEKKMLVAWIDTLERLMQDHDFIEEIRKDSNALKRMKETIELKIQTFCCEMHTVLNVGRATNFGGLANLFEAGLYQGLESRLKGHVLLPDGGLSSVMLHCEFWGETESIGTIYDHPGQIIQRTRAAVSSFLYKKRMDGIQRDRENVVEEILSNMEARLALKRNACALSYDPEVLARIEELRIAFNEISGEMKIQYMPGPKETFPDIVARFEKDTYDYLLGTP